LKSYLIEKSNHDEQKQEMKNHIQSKERNKNHIQQKQEIRNHIKPKNSVIIFISPIAILLRIDKLYFANILHADDMVGFTTIEQRYFQLSYILNEQKFDEIKNKNSMLSIDFDVFKSM
jgi:hypothetical protein